MRTNLIKAGSVVMWLFFAALASVGGTLAVLNITIQVSKGVPPHLAGDLSGISHKGIATAAVYGICIGLWVSTRLMNAWAARMAGVESFWKMLLVPSCDSDER